jgi:hypothetical protein
MGNDNSKGKRFQEAARYGQVYCQTDKSAYFGGETVTGRIYLNLFLPYPGNQLFLKLKGREAVHFVQQRTENYHVEENGVRVMKTRHIDELFEEKHDVIKMTVPMYTWATLLPGQYTIPFAFMLPGSLPSSFHQEGHRYLANVSYRLEAILEPSFKNEPRLKCKQPFVVRQPVKNAQQGHSGEISTKLTSCCCCSKGSNVLTAQFEKNFYAPGEVAQVVMKLDNTESKSDNTRIAFTLKQRLHLSARGRKDDRVLTKVERDLPGIKAGSASDSNFIAINLPAFQGGDYYKTKTWNMTHHLINLKESPEILNSATRSKLITSEYFLEVSCPMSGCCVGTPAISAPIEIYYPELTFAPVVVPQNWHPQEVGQVNVAFGGNMGMNVNVAIPQISISNQMPAQMTVTNQMPGMVVDTQMPNNNQMGFNTQISTNMQFPGAQVTITENQQFGGQQNQQFGGQQNQQFGEQQQNQQFGQNHFGQNQYGQPNQM